MSVLRSGSVLFASHAGAALLSFLRNVIVARALGVEEFGIASTFAVIFTLVETATDTGLEKLIVRDPQGEDQRFLGTMHSIFAIRGAIAAIAMVLLAGPFARYMGLEEITWAYQVLALAPLIRGFVHFDIYRMQRQMRFGGLVAATLAGPIMGLAVVVIGALFVRDFQIVLWALIGFQFAFMVASHFKAERPFRFNLDWEVAHRSIRFGLPLLLNGMLMFAILQGDRLIIGGEIGVEVLGWFSVAWLLVSTPAFVLINTIRSLFLPKLSEEVAEHGLDEARVTGTVEAACFAAIWLITGFFVLGPFVLLLVYGSEFAEALTVLQLIAVAFGFRLVTASNTTIALAGDDTPGPLIAGIVRTLFLPLAFLAAVNGYGAVTLAWIAMTGEFASALAGSWRLAAKLKVNLRPWIPSVAMMMLAVIGALVLDTAYIQPSEAKAPTLWMCLPFIALALIAIVPMGSLRSVLRDRGSEKQNARS